LVVGTAKRFGIDITELQGCLSVAMLDNTNHENLMDPRDARVEVTRVIMDARLDHTLGCGLIIFQSVYRVTKGIAKARVKLTGSKSAFHASSEGDNFRSGRMKRIGGLFLAFPGFGDTTEHMNGRRGGEMITNVTCVICIRSVDKVITIFG
jgi:hypothetical protein